MKNLKDFIYVNENAIASKLCDKVIEEYKNKTFGNALVVDKNTPLMEKVRKCKDLNISLLSENSTETEKLIDKYLWVTTAHNLKQYRLYLKNNNLSVSEDTGYILLKYEEGDFYKQHTDSFTSSPRAVSCSFILNDDYEGGEFAFFDRELNYKLKKGSCIIFPSNFMYPHEIMPVTKGVRYSIVTWFI